ncbi:MAG: DUF1592 domain-containing protein, partial [Planctomycetota bacterium]
TIEGIAQTRQLNSKYLRQLWQMLTGNEEPSSFLLCYVRDKWRQAEPTQIPDLVLGIQLLQQALTKFNVVGQLGEGGKQKQWMEPVSNLTLNHPIRLKLEEQTGRDTILSLKAQGIGNRELDSECRVIWENPRLEFAPRRDGTIPPALSLRSLDRLRECVQAKLSEELPHTVDYLMVLAELSNSKTELSQLAQQRKLDQDQLANWARYLGLANFHRRNIDGLYGEQILAAQGYATVNGWGTNGTPSMLANSAEEDISFLTLTVPGRSVVTHPSPNREALIVWRSPADAKIRIAAAVADVDDKCGNGFAWRIEVQSVQGMKQIYAAGVENGGKDSKTEEGIRVAKGDLVRVVINARDASHACDTTHVELTLTDVDADRSWNLAKDVVDDVLESNPHADSFGNPAVWHFASQESSRQREDLVLPNSTVAAFRDAVLLGKDKVTVQRLAETIAAQLQGSEELEMVDQNARADLLSWIGPLEWAALASAENETRATSAQSADEVEGTDSTHVVSQLDEPLQLASIPKELLENATFVTNVRLEADGKQEVFAKAQVVVNTPSPQLDWSQPILTNEAGLQVAEAQLGGFRSLFPAALCYPNIVPVDEVVTLTLFFREDEALQRLMLDEAQCNVLDRLWDELLFIAQEPIALTVALEQIHQFATQDRPDLVAKFEALKEPVAERADRFRQRLLKAEPLHMENVLEWAAKAWRRPLNLKEVEQLRSFYSGLRAAEFAHEQAIQLLLVRILTSPAFLYRLEKQPDSQEAQLVDDWEMASRLSFFLWSSCPDEHLYRDARSGELQAEHALKEQMSRMLHSEKLRRLSEQFAMQWLHLRDFDQNSDKNESLYPEFASLRTDMYEEAVLFFEDLFRNNRPVLSILDSQYTFLNRNLAEHYQVGSFEGSEWQRVDVSKVGRGSILTMAAFLSSQSGASRTSPILRGNWIYETLLGQRLPRPPADVPQLPEQVPEGLTARQLIEKHSQDEACARCHRRIDPLGFALEGFDALGRTRASEELDLAANLENGTRIDGAQGLQNYLTSSQKELFLRQFCRKLLGFALGRQVILSDEPLIEEMLAKLKQNDYRSQAAIEAVVLSQQFRSIRGANHPGASEKEVD